MIICKDCGKTVAPEECRNLKVNDPKETFGFRLDQLCEECFKVRFKEKAEEPAPEAGTFNRSDIFKVIDDAMEKKDRHVSIFISPDSVSVDIYPYDPHEVEDEN